MQELALFQVGEKRLAVDLPFVRSLHRATTLFEEQPENRKRDVLVLGGKELPLYDLASILGEPTASGNPGGKKVLLVEEEEHPMGLMVDGVDRVIAVESGQIEPLPPVFNGPSLICFPRVLRHGDDLILLLSPKGVVTMVNEMGEGEMGVAAERL